MSFVGNKNLDMDLLMLLNDKDLGAVCGVNKYAKSLCDDPIFWRKRLIKFLKLTNDEVNYLQKHLHISLKDLYIYFGKSPKTVDTKIKWIKGIVNRRGGSSDAVYLDITDEYYHDIPLSMNEFIHLYTLINEL